MWVGKLGIIFSRMPPSPSALKMQRSIYSDSQMLILFFEDKHLIELLKLKEAHQNPLELIQDAILNFQRLCRHLPEGRTLALPSMKPRKTRIGMAALPEALSACSRIVHSKAPRFKKCLHNSETPFEQRFQGLLRQAWKLRRWHVIVAEPGSGKTMGIRDGSAQASREAGMMGGRHYPVLAVTAPKNDPKEAALGNFLLTALGLGARGRWSERKYLLFELLVQYGVECLVIDDAHDLSMPHLIFLKELTDQLKLAYPPYVLGLCLVTAGWGAGIPLKDVFDQEDDDVAAIAASLGSRSPLLPRGEPY
jgi:hypothetical protein